MMLLDSRILKGRIMTKRIGIIGIGEMGFTMALNLLKKGYSVTAYDIQKELLLKM